MPAAAPAPLGLGGHEETMAALRARLAGRAARRAPLAEHRAAAVAVLLIERDGATHVVLTVRAAELRTHSGQVSFPGGACDPEDGSAVATARREAAEEIGIDAEGIEPLGELDDVPTPAGFVITPVVFAMPAAAAVYRPHAGEVAEIFEAPLAVFADPAAAEELGERTYQGIHYRLRAYQIGGRRVWGATERIIAQLLALLVTPAPAPATPAP